MYVQLYLHNNICTAVLYIYIYIIWGKKLCRKLCFHKLLHKMPESIRCENSFTFAVGITQSRTEWRDIVSGTVNSNRVRVQSNYNWTISETKHNLQAHLQSHLSEHYPKAEEHKFMGFTSSHWRTNPTLIAMIV